MTPWLLLLISVTAGTPYGSDATAVDPYLKELRAREPAYVGRVAQVARDGLGTPYHDGPLGEGPGAPYDADPLVDLTRVDCVTYVEQCLALAAGLNYTDSVAKLQEIRYAGGVVDFETRNHFMVADWAVKNAWCVDVTSTLGEPVETVSRRISKRDFFKRVKAPTLGASVSDRDVTIQVIPSHRAKEAVARITKPSVIVFVGNIDWLFALHCGIFLPEEGGAGRLYHASSKSEAVVAVDLADYVAAQSKRYLGFTVYEITTPPFAESE